MQGYLIAMGKYSWNKHYHQWTQSPSLVSTNISNKTPSSDYVKEFFKNMMVMDSTRLLHIT